MSSSKGMNLALYYLERRPRTESELREKLKRKLIAESEIDSIIITLKEYGYINDSKYVINWQRSRNQYKPTGARRLKQELYVKGIAKELIESINVDRDTELELAWQAVQPKLHLQKILTPPIFNRRIFAFLARRGFDYACIKQVFERLAQ